MPSLYEKLGGDKAVHATVEIFYQKVIADKELAPFFSGINMQRQKRMQFEFLTVAFGGPNKYSGQAMRAAHRRPVELGLNEHHFNLVAGHLKQSLLELQVPPELVHQVMAVAASTKQDVLNQ